jgi:flagellar basal body-associated protein FliL
MPSKNPSLEAIMAIILLIVIAALVLVAVIATFVQVAHDGYRQVPTRRELLRVP